LLALNDNDVELRPINYCTITTLLLNFVKMIYFARVNSIIVYGLLQLTQLRDYVT